ASNIQPFTLASAERYDPDGGSWIASLGMLAARAGPTAVALANGTVLVAGGFGKNSALASTETLEPGGASWTNGGDMIEARNGATATLLPDGTVLVLGGVSASGTLASAEL